jgi:hypothetical protein
LLAPAAVTIARASSSIATPRGVALSKLC